jgi:hypothetical protein
MQTALTLRRFSINSFAATIAVLLALTAGGAGGYWLRSPASSVVTKATSPQVTAQSQQVAPPHDMPEENINVIDAADRAAARIANAARAAQTPAVAPHDNDH